PRVGARGGRAGRVPAALRGPVAALPADGAARLGGARGSGGGRPDLRRRDRVPGGGRRAAGARDGGDAHRRRRARPPARHAAAGPRTAAVPGRDLLLAVPRALAAAGDPPGRDLLRRSPASLTDPGAGRRGGAAGLAAAPVRGAPRDRMARAARAETAAHGARGRGRLAGGGGRLRRG